jgi:hypothetical protein
MSSINKFDGYNVFKNLGVNEDNFLRFLKIKNSSFNPIGKLY